MIPYRTSMRARCEFFESIGIDPSTVWESDISPDGYYVFQFSDPVERRIIYRPDGEAVKHLVPWGPGQWYAYLAAQRVDYLNLNYEVWECGGK